MASLIRYDLEGQILRRRHAELAEAVAKATEALAPDAASALGTALDADAKAAEARSVNEKVHARLKKRLDETEALMADLDLDGSAARASAILSGLGFSAATASAPIEHLSGGWRMRVTLAAALFVPCDVLLLDEPTNHLDFPALVWLTKWLQACKATILIVSHDRGFLDDVVSDVIQIRSRS